MGRARTGGGFVTGPSEQSGPRRFGGSGPEITLSVPARDRAASIMSLAGSQGNEAVRMALEDEVSPNAVKVYKSMKEMGFLSEEKMGTAERITQSARLPKTMVMNALQELQNKGWVRRKVREKAAGYHLTK